MTEVPVSVIMPACDAEETIPAALDSLVAQTSREIEVVVVDDGSSDGTSAIVERIATGSPVSIRCVTQPNAGRAAARNRGVVEARGEYLAFVDADDTAEPAMIEHMLTRARATGADLVVCEYLGVDAVTGAVLHRYHEGDAGLYGGSAVERPGLLTKISGSVCNKLVHRSLFDDTGIEFPVGRDFEDLATAYRLCGEARRIEKVDEPLYRYRMGQPASIMCACDERYLHIFDALTVTNRHFLARGTFAALRSDLEVVNFIHSIVGRYDDLLLFGARPVRHEFVDRAFAHMDDFFPGWRLHSGVRAAAGRIAKYVVSTNKPVLKFYTDVMARRAR